MDQTTVVRDFASTIPAQARLTKPFVEDRWVPASPPTTQDAVSSSLDAPAPVPFDDCRMSFAIDISQSTTGSILAEECAFIQNFVGELSPSVKDLARVIP